MKSRPGSKQDDNKPRQDTTPKPEPGNPKPPTDEEVRNIVGGLFRFAGMDGHEKEQPEVPGDCLGRELIAR